MQERAPTEDDPKIASKRALEEHRRLQKLLLGLESVQPLSALVARLDVLRLQVEEHFALEEREDGGLLTVVETRSVHLHSEVDTLRREHLRLRAELDGLRARARSCAVEHQAPLRADVAAWKRRLQQHEEHETQVFMDSWNTDLGAQD